MKKRIDPDRTWCEGGQPLATPRAEIDAARIAREIRRRTRRSQKEIARRMHVTQPRVSAIANAKELTVTTIYRYAAAAGFRIRMTLVPIDKQVSGPKAGRAKPSRRAPKGLAER